MAFPSWRHTGRDETMTTTMNRMTVGELAGLHGTRRVTLRHYRDGGTSSGP